MRFLLFYASDKKRLVAAGAKARSQRAVRAIAKHFNLGEERATPGPVAEKSLPSSAPGKSRRLGERPSTKPERLHPELLFTPSPQKTRRSSPPYGYRLTTLVLHTANQSETGPSESRGAKGGWKKFAFSEGRRRDSSDPEQTATVKRTPAKASNTEQRRFAVSAPKVIRSGTSQGSTPVTKLFTRSSNKTANCLRLCKTTTLSLVLRSRWPFLVGFYTKRAESKFVLRR